MDVGAEDILPMIREMQVILRRSKPRHALLLIRKVVVDEENNAPNNKIQHLLIILKRKDDKINKLQVTATKAAEQLDSCHETVTESGK